MKTHIEDLKRWLKQEGNSATQLAAALGYTSSTTVNKWIERKRIPAHALSRVLLIIREKEPS